MRASPSAIALKIAARWEIDLSPGGVMEPLRLLAYRTVARMGRDCSTAAGRGGAAVRYHRVAPEPTRKVFTMALNSPTDRTLFSVVGRYEQEVMGPRLTDRQLTRIAEAVKRFLFDEIHSAKAAVG